MTERRYEVIEALGTGGFGTVYRARYLGEGGFSQMVALKVLNADMAGVDEIASRLRDEARVLGLVRHRAIVQVHRLVQLDESWTVVMEYVDGADLSHVLKAGMQVPVGPGLEIISEVAAALSVAWSAPGPDGRPLRLLHRDIKPSNIQVTPVGEVKVLDFGIARADFDEREAMTKKLAFGSTEYMAPERLDMLDGPAADVYSLGAVFFEILTGKAFGRTSAVRERHVPRVDQAMAVLSETLGHKYAAITELIGDMLTWDPVHRPTARVVERRALTLRGHIAGEPLRFWAEDNIPDAMAARQKLGNESRTGSILVEKEGEGTSSERLSHGSWDKVPGGSMGTAKRRPTDPTDAPSIALAIGAQPKRPVQLGPVATPLPPPDDDSEEVVSFVPSKEGPPSSPTLVALMDPTPEEKAAAANLADLPDPATPDVAPPPADVGPPPADVGQPTAEAAAEEEDAFPIPDDDPIDASGAAQAGFDELDDDWEPPKRSKAVPLVLFGVAALVLVCGLGGTMASRWLSASVDSTLSERRVETQTVETPTVETPGQAHEGPQSTGPDPSPPTDRAGSTSPPAPVATVAAPAPTAASTPTTTSAPPRPASSSADSAGATQPASGDDGWSLPETTQTPAAPTEATAAAASAPRPPEPARVRVTGDVKSVSLKGAGGTIQVSNGQVAPGSYEIWVRFEGRADQAAGRVGSVTIEPGEKVVINCDQLFAECTRR